MSMVNMHNHPQADILCDCLAHQEARKALVKANEISRQILVAAKKRNTKKVRGLNAKLRQYNKAASLLSS